MARAPRRRHRLRRPRRRRPARRVTATAFVGAETSLVYFDGNSLGRPLAVDGRAARARSSSEQWGGRLIRGWDEGWIDLPLTIGDRLGRDRASARPRARSPSATPRPCCSTSSMRAAVDAQRARAATEIVIDRDNFPTDRYVVEGIAAERGLTAALDRGRHRAGRHRRAARARRSGRETALVVLSHVAYRSALARRRRRRSPRIAHDAGALVLWDLCHSAGSVPVELDAWGVDLAVGCTYKYLNGGPGSPGVRLRRRAAPATSSPSRSRAGWARADPFLMGPTYAPAAGIRRFLSRHPADRRDARRCRTCSTLVDGGRASTAVRAKSVALTDVRDRARRRAARPARRRARLAARRRTARRPRDAEPPADARGHRGAVGARRHPRLPRPARPADRALAAVDVASPRCGAGWRACATPWRT